MRSLTGDSVHESSFSPTLTCVREDSQIIGAGENERGTEMLICKQVSAFIGLYLFRFLFLGQYTILPLTFLIATLFPKLPPQQLFFSRPAAQ